MKLTRRLSYCAGLVFLMLASASSLAAPDKPNIVLIVADNLGYGEIGSNGRMPGCNLETVGR